MSDGLCLLVCEMGKTTPQRCRSKNLRFPSLQPPIEGGRVRIQRVNTGVSRSWFPALGHSLSLFSRLRTGRVSDTSFGRLGDSSDHRMHMPISGASLEPSAAATCSGPAFPGSDKPILVAPLRIRGCFRLASTTTPSLPRPRWVVPVAVAPADLRGCPGGPLFSAQVSASLTSCLETDLFF